MSIFRRMSGKRDGCIAHPGRRTRRDTDHRQIGRQSLRNPTRRRGSGRATPPKSHLRRRMNWRNAFLMFSLRAH